MSIDMQQFHGVFFEESQEHLEEMEQLLMEIDTQSPDVEQLNSIFRAAHSIKGGSGIFGFDALTSLTHVMENLLDKARKGTISLSVSIIDTLLGNVDQLKIILHCYRVNEPIDWSKIEAEISILETILQPEQATVAEDDGFGFFSLPVQPDEESFGFFDELETEESSKKSKSAKKKSTSNIKSAPKTEKKSTTKVKKAEKTAIDDDDGFGFFELPDIVNENIPEQAKELSDELDNSITRPMQNGNGLVSKPTELTEKSKPSQLSNEATTIRVDTNKIDSLVNLVGEIVITQSMLSVIGAEFTNIEAERLHAALGELERNTREIQEAVMSMRMLPMSFVFNRFPRVVRDLSGKLGKKVELIIEGGTTEIDKGLIEKLVDPLTHLIRNSIDHGIESPELRLAAGKPEIGTVKLIAEQSGGNILIRILDDGAGLDRDKILTKARENGLDVSNNLNDKQVWSLIFSPGFSTATVVTDVSGRGVGMDVVKRNIESIGGLVEIESIAGSGSSFNIRLPLTLAIVDGMCVSVGDQTLVIPLVNIVESIQPLQEQVKTMANEKLLWIRDEYWPILPLYKTMNIEDAIPDPTTGVVVLIETSKKRFGILVDGLAGQQQVVIKSLEQHYRRVAGVAGATIMGDGSVALILDVESLATQIEFDNFEVEALNV